jgi:hypothetical protein
MSITVGSTRPCGLLISYYSSISVRHVVCADDPQEKDITVMIIGPTVSLEDSLKAKARFFESASSAWVNV